MNITNLKQAYEPKPREFSELTIEEMIIRHDGWHMMSDDHSRWVEGRYQLNCIKRKVLANGGWNKDLQDLWESQNKPSYDWSNFFNTQK